MYYCFDVENEAEANEALDRCIELGYQFERFRADIVRDIMRGSLALDPNNRFVMYSSYGAARSHEDDRNYFLECRLCDLLNTSDYLRKGSIDPGSRTKKKRLRMHSPLY